MGRFVAEVPNDGAGGGLVRAEEARTEPNQRIGAIEFASVPEAAC